MSGLAIGSVIWGGVADRTSRPLVLYGALELGIGVCAGAFVFGFDALSGVYWSALARVGNAGGAAVALKAGLCVGAMLPATFCMGGTLPVLSRSLGLERRALGRGVAYLYAVNSFGAAVGAVVTGFSLIATWGFDRPFLAAAVVNLAVGVAAMVMGSRMRQPPPSASVQSEPLVDAAPGPFVAGVTGPEIRLVRGYTALVLLGAAVSGAVAMVYEVAWIRLCSLVLGSSTYSFSIMLTAFITGIAAGSLVYTLTGSRRGKPLRFFAYTSLSAAVLLLACLAGYDRLPYYLGRVTAVLRGYGVSFAGYQAATLLFCVAVMLPLTFVSGLNFPALAQAMAQARSGIGRPVSYVLFANTAGTICGAIVGGLYLLPAVGLRGTFLLGISATVAVAVVVLAADRGLPWGMRRAVAPLSLAGLVAYVVWMPGWDARLLVAGEFRSHDGIDATDFATYLAGLKYKLVFYQDGISATVSVEQRPSDVVLRVNGKADASAVSDIDTELLSGHLPAVLHAHARHVLVIGYGSGITVGALLQHPIESVDVVEISPEVVAADTHFRAYNRDPLHDPRTHLHVEDARTFLYRSRQQYDLIVSEPSSPWIAGIGNLFTQEFFAQARQRLSADGLLLQWFHTYETSDRLIALMLRTVGAEFGEVRVFQPNRSDAFLVAAPAPRPIDHAAMARAFADASGLQLLGINRLATLLALEVLPDVRAAGLSETGPRNHDRLPVLEYGAPRAFFDGHDASLFANAEPSGTDGFIQSPADLSLDDYSDAGRYLRRADMVYYNRTLSLIAAWLAHAPADADALDLLDGWIGSHANSPSLLRTLAGVRLADDPTTAHDYAHVLMRVVRSLRVNVQAADVVVMAPVVQAAARRSPRGPDLLRELGDLYLVAGARSAALAAFDAAVEQADDDAGYPSSSVAVLQCRRGMALEKMTNTTGARQAFQSCLRADASNAQALAALGRLDADAP